MIGCLTVAPPPTALAVPACSDRAGPSRALGLAAAAASAGDAIPGPEPGSARAVGVDRDRLAGTPRAASGNVPSGRAVLWPVSGSLVGRVEGGFGQTVGIRAVGTGSALVTATSEGKSGSGSILVP